MNEIVGTIYYVLANDHNSDWANYAESDTYSLFHTLMMDMRDVFVPDMDMHTSGIQGRIDNMQKLLATHDPEVQAHLDECGIDASFYAIRWLTTLLSREFLLPDTIRLWDSMFASTHKENFLRYVCGTMVMMVREDLLKGDFSSCLRLLQSYPPKNVDDILESSRSLWIYESQITLACTKCGISLHQALQIVSPPPAIIMAFGLRGGMAPNLSEQLHYTASQVQEQVQTAKEGLLGRAKRFWGGWNGDETATTPTKTTPAPAEPESDLAPPSRFRAAWNRGRSNTSDSETPSSSNGGTGTDAGADTDTKTGAGLASLQDETAANTPTATPVPAPARRAIWNRGGTKAPEAEPEPVPAAPAWRTIWNRGPARSNSGEATEVPVSS
jgi:hypothetical protein